MAQLIKIRTLLLLAGMSLVLLAVVASCKLAADKVSNKVTVGLDQSTGQYLFTAGGLPVLQYNYQTVYLKDVVRLENQKNVKLEYDQVTGVYLEEFLKENPGSNEDSIYNSSIYSQPRSDYIHPLFGLDGEMLTRDWPDGGHPHHRGIFWAWPEVEWGKLRGDIYALQRIFARPTGKVELTHKRNFAQLVAENLWMWEEKHSIVREHALIRVYRAREGVRIIDVAIRFEALKDSITIATRGTNSYGTFNCRMQTPESQEISYYTDKQGSVPLRAWADFSGVFRGSQQPSGMMILQHKDNPEYPGPWQEYPDLSWIQPVFPTHGTRYPIRPDQPLILRYRLVIHQGGRPDQATSEKYWDAFNQEPALLPVFSK